MKTSIIAAFVASGFFYSSALAQSQELVVVSGFSNECIRNDKFISNGKISLPMNVELGVREISNIGRTESFPENYCTINSMEAFHKDIVSGTFFQNFSNTAIRNSYNRNKHFESRKTNKLLAWNLRKKTLSPVLTLPLFISNRNSSPYNFVIDEKNEISDKYFNELLLHPFVVVGLKTGYCRMLLEKRNNFQSLKQSVSTYKLQGKNTSIHCISDSLTLLKSQFLCMIPRKLPNTSQININKDATRLPYYLLRLKIK